MLTGTICLTVFSITLEMTDPATVPVSMRFKSEWPLWLVLIQAIGSVLALVRCGLPRSVRGWGGIVLCNLWLLAVAVLSFRHELEIVSMTGLDAAVRCLLAAGWLYVGVGGIALILWSRRNTGRSIIADESERSTGVVHRRTISLPVWGKLWFSTILLMGLLEVGTRVVAANVTSDLGEFSLALPERWEHNVGEAIHIAAIGGSTTLGFPYQPKIDLPTIFAARLEQLFPGQEFVVSNLAETGANLKKSASRLGELAQKPDIILVYTGHNEFFYNLEDSTRTAKSTLPGLDLFFQWSSAYVMLTQTLNRARETTSTSLIVQDRMVSPPLFSHEILKRRLNVFRDQLDQLARFCEREEILSIWYVPAAGEGTFEPNRSVSERPLTLAEDTRLQHELNRARALDAAQHGAQTAEIFEALLDEFPGVAEVHFRYAESLVQRREYQTARQEFRRAIDLDGFPCQIQSDYQQAVAYVADKYDLPKIYAENVLRPLTRDGILDRSVIHDNVHPTLRGHLALGLAAAALPAVREWARQHGLMSRQSPPESLTLEQLVQHTGFTVDDLATAYDRTAWCLEHLSRWRSDDARRLHEAEQYRRWADQLRAGRIKPGDDGTESLTQRTPPGVRFPDEGCLIE